MKITNGMTRLILLIITVTACIAFIIGVVARIKHPESTTGLPVDQFMLLAIAVYSFFFGKQVRDEVQTGVTTVTTPSTNKVDTSVITTPSVKTSKK